MTPSSLRRFGTVAPTGAGLTLSRLNPAHRTGRTIFPSRVFDPAEAGRLLKSGHHSRKIGRVVMKGRWRGMPLLTLTLEERATCPRSCAMWAGCYGNNMQAADRIVAGAELESALTSELADLQRRHPRGFVVRLHVLGDFYSAGYVDLWARALDAHPALRVFGFTARDPGGDPIGAALFRLATARWDRFAVRFSGRPGARLGAQIVPGQDASAIICPAQRGLTDCCATCALCWQSDRSIAFLKH